MYLVYNHYIRLMNVKNNVSIILEVILHCKQINKYIRWPVVYILIYNKYKCIIFINIIQYRLTTKVLNKMWGLELQNNLY